MPDISAPQQAPRPHHSSSAEKPGHKYNSARQMQILKYYNRTQIQMQVLVKRDIKKQSNIYNDAITNTNKDELPNTISGRRCEFGAITERGSSQIRLETVHKCNETHVISMEINVFLQITF